MTLPEEVVRAALDARDAIRYDEVVALADVASVVALHQGCCDLYRQPSLEQFARDRPDLQGDQLRRVFEATCRHIADSQKYIVNTIPGVHTRDELLAVDPSDFLQRAMEKDDMRCDIIRRLRERGRPVREELLGRPEGVSYEMLGHVPDGPHDVHVLYREVIRANDEPEYRGEPQLVTARRQSDGSWRLVANRIDFLESRGSRVTYLDPEFAELYEDELRGPREA